MNGIHVRWTQRRDENMEAFLTFDQARARFGLGGTPDSLVRQRVGQVASREQIREAAKELGNPRIVTWTAQQIINLVIRETDRMPEPEPVVCCACKQPLPNEKEN